MSITPALGSPEVDQGLVKGLKGLVKSITNESLWTVEPKEVKSQFQWQQLS